MADSSQPAVAGTSQEVPDQGPASSSSSNSILRVTLLAAEWETFKDDVSTLNTELAKQLAKVNNVKVTVFVPECSEEDKKDAADLGITIVEAEELLGFEPIDWLAHPPRDLSIDIVVGHGIEIGRYAQIIKDSHKCRWVQVVHMNPEGEALYRAGPGCISQGEKEQQVELELCKRADFVVAVGQKLAEEFTASLRPCNKEVFELTPGIFSEFDSSKQVSKDLRNFRVLVLGQTDLEDFELKGYDIAAQAFAELKDKSYHLIFVGAPKGKKEEVKRYFIKYHISKRQLRVRSFCYSREEMAARFCEADLLIMPRSEGFGLTALEALSAGLPLLVHGNSGFGKALSKVRHGSSYIVDSDVPKDWAEAVKRVRQKDRTKRLAEAKSLSTNYAKCYDWQNQCQLLIGKCHNMKLGEPESSKKEAGSQKSIKFQTSRARKCRVEHPKALSDGDLARQLKQFGVPVGPITDATRPLYQKRLEKLLVEERKKGSSATTVVPQEKSPPRTKKRKEEVSGEFSDANDDLSEDEQEVDTLKNETFEQDQLALSDGDLARQLKQFGVPVGPITDATRPLYQKRLEKLLVEERKKGSSATTVAPQEKSPPRTKKRKEEVSGEFSDANDDLSEDEQEVDTLKNETFEQDQLVM